MGRDVYNDGTYYQETNVVSLAMTPKKSVMWTHIPRISRIS